MHRRFAKRDDAEAWKKRATHMIDDPAELERPLVRVQLRGRWREEPAALIYRFDQAIAKTPARYFAEYDGFDFRVQVSERHADAVRSIAARLRPVYRRYRSFAGSWTEVEPPPLSKAHRDHPGTPRTASRRHGPPGLRGRPR
jgi:hypothetical protein